MYELIACTCWVCFFFSFMSHFLNVKAFGFCKGGVLMVVETASSLEILLNLTQKIYMKESNS